MFYLNLQKVIKKIGNRFDLVLIASFRSRQLQLFSKNTFLKNSKNDKPTVISLKEIENDFIDKNILDIVFNSKNDKFNI